MSVEAPTQPRLADDDGSGNATFWEHAEDQMSEVEPDDALETKELFVPLDLGRQRMFAGQTALAGFDRDFHTDRIIPRRLAGPLISQTFMGPDYYIG